MTDDTATRLRAEIAQLRQALASLAAMPDAQAQIAATLAVREQALAALESASPAPGNQQQISGSQVGVALTGNNSGIINVTQGGSNAPGGAAAASPAHIALLINEHTRRLQVLQRQAAQAGYNARPEVLTEIADIEAELARLRAILGA